MTTQSFKRKLTAILSADVMGYSRLMAEDEEATVRTITAYRKVISTCIQKHRGRVVDSPGDNLLAEFASVVDAVRCAVEIQEELKARNAELPENRRMEFRIGINLGDVIQEGERIYGDGVNIAARVEGLADGGGICISGSVYDQVKNKLALVYEHLGECTVKNIAEPVRVYRLGTGLTSVESVTSVKKSDGVRRGQWVALVVVIALCMVAGVWTVWKLHLHKPYPAMEVASLKKIAFPLPKKPSIAVLPFENFSDDPELEYLADGITDDLITDLSKISALFVIARNSTFTYKGRPTKIQQVAEELGVRYVLEGSVRKIGDRVRINAQLVDAITGHHLWAERYDGKLRDIFALQDKIIQKIVAALKVKLTSTEEELLLQRDTENASAYDAFLQARHHLRQYGRDNLARAFPYLKKAVELDPDFGQAHAVLADLYGTAAAKHWDQELGWSNAESLAKSHLQIAMKNPTAYAYRVASHSRLYEGEYQEAVAQAERAVSVAPNDPDTLYTMAVALIYSGESAKAIDYLKKAMRLEPHYPAEYSLHLGLALFSLEQYEEAATLLETLQKRDTQQPPWVLGAAYAKQGREQEAEHLLADYIKKKGLERPTVAEIMKSYPFRAAKDADRLAEGLHKAGLPMK